MHIVPMTKQELAQFIADKKDQLFGGTTKAAEKIINVVDDEEIANAIEEAIRAVERDAGLIEDEEVIKEETPLSDEESSIIFDDAMKFMEMESAEIAAAEIEAEAVTDEVEEIEIIEDNDSEIDETEIIEDNDPEIGEIEIIEDDSPEIDRIEIIEEDYEEIEEDIPELEIAIVEEVYDIPFEDDFEGAENTGVSEEIANIPEIETDNLEAILEDTEEEYTGSFEDAFKDEETNSPEPLNEDLDVVELENDAAENIEEKVADDTNAPKKENESTSEKPVEEPKEKPVVKPSPINHPYHTIGKARWIAPISSQKKPVHNDAKWLISNSPVVTPVKNDITQESEKDVLNAPSTQSEMVYMQKKNGSSMTPTQRNIMNSKNKKSNGKIKIILAIIIAIAILAGGGFAAYTFLLKGHGGERNATPTTNTIHTNVIVNEEPADTNPEENLTSSVLEQPQEIEQSLETTQPEAFNINETEETSATTISEDPHAHERPDGNILFI